MKGIDTLLIENFELKLKKHEVVKNQQYEKAARLRDSEKYIERKVWELLSGKSVDEYDYKEYDKMISSYLKERYNIDFIESPSSYRQLVRDIKLKSIGI